MGKRFGSAFGAASLVSIACLVASSAGAAWTDDTTLNTPVAPEIDSSRTALSATPDGLGGFYLVWYESSTTRIERISPAGELSWREGPLILAGAVTSSHDGTRSVLADGEHGLFVGVVDGFTAREARVHRVTPDGGLPWGPDGVPLVDDATGDSGARLVADKDGGVIAAWRRSVVGGDWCLGTDEVWVQHVTATGERPWGAEGLRVGAARGERGHVRLAPDGSGGAWIGWQDGRILCLSPFGYGPDTYLAHVAADGTLRFGPGGREAEPDPDWQYFTGITHDADGGAIVVYSETPPSSGPMTLHVQRFDASGVPVWPARGTIVDGGGADPNAVDAQVLSDGEGGAVVAWLHEVDSRAQELRVARVLDDGTIAWSRVIRGSVRFFQMTSRFDGDVILAWDDRPGTAASDITTQLLSVATGEPLLAPDGVIVTDARSIQHHPRIAPIGCTTAYGWLDVRTSFSSVWAQRLDPTGAPGIAADPLLFVTKDVVAGSADLRWEGAERCSEWHVARGTDGALLTGLDLTPLGVPGPEWSDEGVVGDGRDLYYVVW